LADLKIISGGQSGVDRAALDAALELGIDCGGWCPKGRRAEDGPIDTRYPLIETTSEEYEQRTGQNVLRADGTLILTIFLPLTGGTALTHELAIKHQKPLLIVDLEEIDIEEANIDAAVSWLAEHHIKTLNVAGPRESQQPGIYALSREFLLRLFRRLL